MSTIKWAFRMEGESAILTTPDGERRISTKSQGRDFLRQLNVLHCYDEGDEVGQWIKANSALLDSTLPAHD